MLPVAQTQLRRLTIAHFTRHARTQHFSSVVVNKRPLRDSDVAGQERIELSLANEANAVAIWTLRGGKSVGFRDFTNLCLVEVADWKHCLWTRTCRLLVAKNDAVQPPHLCNGLWVNKTQEVALVLDGVNTTQ